MLEWVEKNPDWHEAALKLDGGVECEKMPLLKSIALPTMALTEYGKTQSKIGQWSSATRLLFVPMNASLKDAQNLVISTKGATAVAKDGKHMRIGLQGADSKALSFSGGEFHLDPVSIKEFLKGWRSFMAQCVRRPHFLTTLVPYMELKLSLFDVFVCFPPQNGSFSPSNGQQGRGRR